MGTATTEWRQYAYQLAADGEWHDYEDLRDAIMKRVPPGIAWRQAEKERQSQMRYRRRVDVVRRPIPENGGRSMPRSDRQIAEIGAKSLARRALVGPRWVEQVVDGRRMLKLRPAMLSRKNRAKPKSDVVV